MCSRFGGLVVGNNTNVMNIPRRQHWRYERLSALSSSSDLFLSGSKKRCDEGDNDEEDG